MFDAIFLKNPAQEQAEAFYGLLAKEPGQVTGSDLAAAKGALDQMNERDNDAGVKAYRDSCVALSLFVLYGGGTERFDQKGYGQAFAILFPGRDGETVARCAGFVPEMDRVLYRDLPKKYESLKELAGAMEGWELIHKMVKRRCLDVMLRIQDFASVQAAVRELSGEIVAMEPEVRESVVALGNEFGSMRGGVEE